GSTEWPLAKIVQDAGPRDDEHVHPAKPLILPGPAQGFSWQLEQSPPYQRRAPRVTSKPAITWTCIDTYALDAEFLSNSLRHSTNTTDFSVTNELPNGIQHCLKRAVVAEVADAE